MYEILNFNRSDYLLGNVLKSSRGKYYFIYKNNLNTVITQNYTNVVHNVLDVLISGVYKFIQRRCVAHIA